MYKMNCSKDTFLLANFFLSCFTFFKKYFSKVGNCFVTYNLIAYVISNSLKVAVLSGEQQLLNKFIKFVESFNFYYN